jgi:uncharacterized protein YciI
MPLFIVTIEYTESMDQVEKHTPDHRAFLADLKEKGQLVASGPFDPRTGGMLIMQADSAEAVDTTLQYDPFRANDIASYNIRGWKPTIGVERFE